MAAATANTTPIALVEVWVRLEGREPEKIEIRADANIDDLKKDLFVNNRDEKRYYHGVVNNVKLPPSAPVPQGTTVTNPIVFVRTEHHSPQDLINDSAVTRTTKPEVPHPVETIHYENGDKYVGEVNSKREPNGKGNMLWKNGRRYEGHWRNGKKDGSGVEYGANGAVNFIGDWKDDELISPANENV